MQKNEQRLQRWGLLSENPHLGAGAPCVHPLCEPPSTPPARVSPSQPKAPGTPVPGIRPKRSTPSSCLLIEPADAESATSPPPTDTVALLLGACPIAGQSEAAVSRPTAPCDVGLPQSKPKRPGTPVPGIRPKRSAQLICLPIVEPADAERATPPHTLSIALLLPMAGQSEAGASRPTAPGGGVLAADVLASQLPWPPPEPVLPSLSTRSRTSRERVLWSACHVEAAEDRAAAAATAVVPHSPVSKMCGQGRLRRLMRLQRLCVTMRPRTTAAGRPPHRACAFA